MSLWRAGGLARRGNGKRRHQEPRPLKNAETKKYDYIDALRGFAIMGVVLVHSSHWVAPSSALFSKIAAQGSRGVQLFYIASALTLFLSMAGRASSEERPILGFFIRRFFRIAPAFYLAIIVYTACDGLSSRYWAPDGIKWWFIPLTACFLNGWCPGTIKSVVPGGWSIAVEMTFYLLVPFLFARLKSIKATVLALLISTILANVASAAVIQFLSPRYADAQKYIVEYFAHLWFASQLPVFILGIVLYHLIKRQRQGDKRGGALLLAASLLLLLALAVRTPASFLANQLLHGVAFVSFALSLHRWPCVALVNRATVWIGRLSYSVYLVHFMVLRILKSVFADGFGVTGNQGCVLAFLLVLGASLGVSSLTYRFVETPGINLGKSIIRKL